MKNLFKRAFSLMLVLVMCLGMLPCTTFAAEKSATISFASTAQRTSFSTSAQVWENENVKLTNNKGSSSSDVANYSNPVRFYASSNLVFEAPGNITKIVITASSSSYATVFKNSAGSEAAVSGSTVTITPTASSATYTIAKLTAQVRAKSVTVTYSEAGGCAHANQTTTTVDATCTVAGSTTVTCKDCGEVISTTTIPAGHNYNSVVTPPTATEQGYTTHTCSACGDVKIDSYTEALGETYTVTFKVPEGVTAPADMTCNKSGITLPTADVPEAFSGYKFAGWAASVVADTTVAPELFKANETYIATANTTLYAVYSVGSGSDEYVKTDIGSIGATDKVVITMTYTDGTVYALSSANGTSKAPAATTVTVADDKLSANPATDLIWNVGGNSNGYIFYPDGSTTTWLYCTNTNNGVRVGTNTANTFIIDATSGYLKHTGTSRYVGVYRSNPDWRCYTNTTGNTADQTLAFYVKGDGALTYSSLITDTECAHANQTTTTVKATCTEAGSVTVTCDDCETVISSETIPATNHPNTSGVIEAPTCTEDGSKTLTCKDCGATVSTEVLPATGHSMDGGVCTLCGCECPDYSGDYYIATKRTETGNYFYMTNDLGTASTKRYVAVDSGLTTLPEKITGGDSDKIFTLTLQGDGSYLISTEGGFLAWTSGNSGTLVEEADAQKLTVELTDGVYHIHFTGDEERYLSLNSNTGSDYFAFYKGTQSQDLTLVKIADECLHENTTTTTVDATCTKEGSVTVTCDDCFATVSTETVPAAGHSYEDGRCACGQKAGAQVIVNGTATGYTTVQEAVNAASKGAYIQLSDYSTENVTVDKDLYLDLNGFDLDGVIVAKGATLYGVDSTTDDYDCSDGYGTIAMVSGDGDVAFQYKATVNGKVRRYVTYNEGNNAVSFHRIYVGVTSISLRPGASGMGYKATVAGDDKVIEMMDENAISMTMWVEGNDANAQTVYMTKEKVTANMMVVSARVQGIDVEKNGETVLCATVSMHLNGQTITSSGASYSLRQAVEAIATAIKDGTTYSETQMSAIYDFCSQNSEAMADWTNIGYILNWTANA